MAFDSLSVVLAVAVALGFDTFAVGLAIGTGLPGVRASFRLWFHFGLFQFLMPLLGWSAGRTLLPLIADFDHWVAFGLLVLIASRMFIESLKSTDENDKEALDDPTRGWQLVALSLATSFDALGVGFSMGLSGTRPLFPSIIIGCVASLMTYAGIRLGTRASVHVGKKAGTLGAFILFIIAFKLLEI